MGVFNRRHRTRQDPARQVLGMAASFLALAAFLYLLSKALGASSSALLQPVGQGLGAPAPYLLLIGAILLAVSLAIRLRHGVPPASKLDSSQHSGLIGGTTVFGSQLDSRMGDLVAEPSTHAQRPPATAWNARVFRDIEWQRFEAMCTALFAQAGFEARTQSHGADGGCDIWLHSQHIEGPAALVRCQHWLKKKVGIKEMREFSGVLASHKLLRGTFATTGTFSPDAREFAKANGISPLDGLGLLALISQRTVPQKKELLQIAYDGEYWRPTCATCGVKMVERRARKRGRSFWGCVNYPGCSFMLPLRKPS